MTNGRDERHEALRDDLAAYALGALTPAEATELEEHLRDCARCRERLRWLRSATDLLPASVEQRTPPEGLRERLLAVVQAESARPAEVRAESRRHGVSWLGSARRALLRPAIALAATLLLAVGLGAGYLLRSGEDATLVEGVPVGSSGVSATLERHDGSATLHLSELPPSGAGHVYEVWIERGGAVEPAGLFAVGATGTAAAAVAGSLDGADAVLVTREPSGGSPEPTSAPLIEVPLDA